jgi:hypothetical protein
MPDKLFYFLFSSRIEDIVMKVELPPLSPVEASPSPEPRLEHIEKQEDDEGNATSSLFDR